MIFCRMIVGPAMALGEFPLSKGPCAPAGRAANRDPLRTPRGGPVSYTRLHSSVQTPTPVRMARHA